jgi:hypothetical protein
MQEARPSIECRQDLSIIHTTTRGDAPPLTMVYSHPFCFFGGVSGHGDGHLSSYFLFPSFKFVARVYL